MSFRRGDRVRVLPKYAEADPEAPQSLIGAEGVVQNDPHGHSTFVVQTDDTHGTYGDTWLFLPDEVELVAS